MEDGQDDGLISMEGKEVERLKEEVAIAKEELERLKAQRVRPKQQTRKMPSPPPQEPEGDYQQQYQQPRQRKQQPQPNLEYTDSLITREQGAIEVVTHLKMAKVVTLISMGGLFCVSIGSMFQQMVGAGVAFVFCLALAIYLWRVQTELTRLSGTYRIGTPRTNRGKW